MTLWTDAEDGVLRAAYPHMPAKAISGVLLHRSYRAIRIRAHHLGIRKKPQRGETRPLDPATGRIVPARVARMDAVEAYMVEHYRSRGYLPTVQHIAAELGTCGSEVHRCMYELMIVGRVKRGLPDGIGRAKGQRARDTYVPVQLMHSHCV